MDIIQAVKPRSEMIDLARSYINARIDDLHPRRAQAELVLSRWQLNDELRPAERHAILNNYTPGTQA
jgi:hypothetical protein